LQENLSVTLVESKLIAIILKKLIY
jgi:hypothetical protein